MYRRLNITLAEDVLARADAFAKRERYTRSALIAEALDAFVASEGAAGITPGDDPVAVDGPLAGGTSVSREARAVYAPEAVGLNPSIRPHVSAIISACRRHGATYAALVGSSTQPDPAIVPRDLDLLVRFGPGWEGHARRYLGLKEELEGVLGRPVDLIEEDAVRNERLRSEFEWTRVVLYEAA